MAVKQKKKVNVTNCNILNKLENITKKTNWTLIAPSVATMPFSCDMFSFTTMPTKHILVTMKLRILLVQKKLKEYI